MMRRGGQAANRPVYPKLEPTALAEDDWAKHAAWVQSAVQKGANSLTASVVRRVHLIPAHACVL